MHSLFITLLEMITWAKEGAGLFRLITVLLGRADTCTVLYCTVLFSREGPTPCCVRGKL